MFTTLMIWIWLGCAPLGYLACRWGCRFVDNRWTRNDRMASILFALSFGPITIPVIALSVLINKVLMSDWGNKEVRW
jgi:hypothetical protein